MAITIEAKPNVESRGTDDSTIEYIITGTRDRSSAYDALDSHAPTTVAGIPRDNISVTAVSVQDNIDVSRCVWNGEARYRTVSRSRTSDPPETGETELSFSTSGATRNISQSYNTTNAYGTGVTTDDYKGAIGVTRDGIEGADVVIPSFSFSYTNYKADDEVDISYIQTMFSLTGKVNNAIFKDFGIGEVLFLGADGRRRNDDDYSITYRFECQPSRSDITIGDITGIEVQGWDYLWVKYEEDVVNENKIQNPIAVYVERVYKSGDFSLLDID